MSLPARPVSGQPAQGRDGSGWPCPRADPRAVAARVPGTGPGARHAGTGFGETGAAVTHPRGRAHPGRIRTSGQLDPARGMTRIQQPGCGKPRAHQIVLETGGKASRFAAGAGKPGRSLDDLAPGGVRAALTPPTVVLSCISGRGCLCREPARPARRRARPGALRSGDRRGDAVWQTRQAPPRHPPDVRGSPAPGNCLAAAPKPRRVRLLLGWPMSQSSLQLPVLVSALPWA